MPDSSPVDSTFRRILDLTFYAFNQKGYKAVSMDLVARELRISKKTIYKHFHSKEEILETAMSNSFSDFEQRTQALFHGKDPAQVLFSFFELYRQFHRNFSPVLREEIQTRLPHLEDRIRAFERQVLHKNFASWIKAFRKTGQIDYPSPTRELTSTLMSMMAGMADSPDEKVEFILATVLKGMASGKKKRKK